MTHFVLARISSEIRPVAPAVRSSGVVRLPHLSSMALSSFGHSPKSAVKIPVMPQFKPPIVGQYTQYAVFSRQGLTLASGNPKIMVVLPIFAFPSRRGSWVGNAGERGRVRAPSFSPNLRLMACSFALSLGGSQAPSRGHHNLGKLQKEPGFDISIASGFEPT